MWIAVKNEPKVSKLVIDQDLDMGAFKIKCDHIAESTGAHGLTIDHKMNIDHIGENTGAHGLGIDNLIVGALPLGQMYVLGGL